MNIIRNDWLLPLSSFVKIKKKPKTNMDHQENTERFSKYLMEHRSRLCQQQEQWKAEDLSEKFHDPYLFKDMKKAVVRIQQAIEKNERVLVYGDYDVDGITATSILRLFLRSLGLETHWYIPNRLTEGYGLSEQGVEMIVQKEIDLLITVDCGITAIEEMDRLKKAKIDCILTDHHRAGDVLPDVYALINPNAPDQGYPFCPICGAVVVLKLVQALCIQLGLEDEVWQSYIDLASFGTIADVMPLIGENRYLVAQGIKSLKNKKQRSAVQAIHEMLSCSSNEKCLDSQTIAFQLSPRINAAGRMGQAKVALDLFMTSSLKEARSLAGILEKLNEERKTYEQEAYQEMNQVLLTQEEDFCSQEVIVLYSENLHPGILGILAAKFCKRYFKPVLILAQSEVDEDGRILLKGSARSFGKIDILKALREANQGLLEQVGGHTHAAGISIYADHLEAFRQQLNEVVRKEGTGFERPQYKIDCYLGPEDLTIEHAKMLEQLEPYGEAQPEFVFLSQDLCVQEVKTVGAKGQHLQFRFSYGSHKNLQGISFYTGALAKVLKAGQGLDLVYKLKVNRWRQREQIQLFIEDFRLTSLCNTSPCACEEEKSVETEAQEERKSSIFEHNQLLTRTHDGECSTFSENSAQEVSRSTFFEDVASQGKQKEDKYNPTSSNLLEEEIEIEIPSKSHCESSWADCQSCVDEKKKEFLKHFMEESGQKYYFQRFYQFLEEILCDENLNLLELAEFANFHSWLWDCPYSIDLSKRCLDVMEEAGFIECCCWSHAPEIYLCRLLPIQSKEKKVKLSSCPSFQALLKECEKVWH